MNRIPPPRAAGVISGGGCLAPSLEGRASQGTAINQAYCSSLLRFLVGCVLVLTATSALAQRQMEHLGRGVVALVQEDGGVFVGWRMLGTDRYAVAFDIYRATGDQPAVRLNGRPVDDVTFWIDREADLSQSNAYSVRAITGARDDAVSEPFVLPAQTPARPYLELPLQTPSGYTPNDASVGDLDGDGEYEIVLHQAGRAKDNAHAGMTDPPILQAYKLDGTLLWQINLGINIREGAHYTQFLVYDLDGDGRAEVVCKTADGSVDGAGKVIGDASADYRNDQGRILAGPEFFTVFDGLTGAALATADYIPPRHPDTHSPSPDQMKQVWGDGYGNRLDRFNAAVAYLDGRRPSFVLARGYYTRTVLAAFSFRNGKIEHEWTFDSASGRGDDHRYGGQGNHNLSVADVDGDGRDEIVFGSCVIDHDGDGLYTTGWGHGDAIHVANMDPNRPGLQVVIPHESPAQYGPNALACFEARTGKLILGVEGNRDIGRGVAFDIDPRFPGFEMWASGGTGGLYNINHTRPDRENGPRGAEVSTRRLGSMNFGVWWDGDPLRELLSGNQITKWNWEAEREDRILTAEGCSANNGSKATPTLSADILGDWREEVIWRADDGQALRIYTTTIPTQHRFYTFMHDPHYRLSIAWQNVGYNQPPHTSFFVGHDMRQPPRPRIITRPYRDNP